MITHNPIIKSRLILKKKNLGWINIEIESRSLWIPKNVLLSIKELMFHENWNMQRISAHEKWIHFQLRLSPDSAISNTRAVYYRNCNVIFPSACVTHPVWTQPNGNISRPVEFRLRFFSSYCCSHIFYLKKFYCSINSSHIFWKSQLLIIF